MFLLPERRPVTLGATAPKRGRQIRPVHVSRFHELGNRYRSSKNQPLFLMLSPARVRSRW